MEKDNIVQIDSFIPGMKKGKPITLMKGTPNQKTLMLEMPGGKMSAQDLQTIKKAYGLPADISFQQTQELLKKIEASDRETLLAPIDIFEKGTPEYYGELAGKTADAIARDQLIKDPMNFYYNQAAKEFSIPNPGSYIPFLGKYLPDDIRLPQNLVSKPSFEMISGS